VRDDHPTGNWITRANPKRFQILGSASGCATRF
jgi:hypothetical protein